MNQEPFINWKALSGIHMAQRPPVRPENGVNMWDLESVRYDKMSALEKELTVKQVDALPLSPEDTVLDMGCGCGRLSVPVAQRVKAVTSLDSSEKMLSNCEANAKAAGVENLTPLFLDFFEAEAGVNVPVHDIVFCSRSAAIWEIEKLCTFARKYAAVLIFANAPSLPELLGKLFSGTTEEPAGRGPHRIRDRRLDYNALWNTVYDLGYEPNCTIVPDGFTARYASVEEACDDLRMLGTVDPDREETYRQNVMQFLTRREDGDWDLLILTRTAVIWWEVHPEKF